ncbi:MAG: AAA family ATPase, partial [Campylobacter sp.]|nr:AAA family ATPase [Campylobacter sp.]
MLNFVLEKLEKSNLFITGGGGVGKSYITKDIINAYKGAKKPVVVLGSTGISAVEIGGVTLHSFFKLGICKNADELKQIDKKQKDKISELKKILKTAKLIVIDEISMISAEVFDLVYYRLINSEFSGKVLVVGDFYQLPPVQKKDETQKPQNSLFSGYYAFSSYGWTQLNFAYIEMIGSKRTQDENLYKMLSNLRVGVVNDDLVEFLKSRLIDFSEAKSSSTMIFGRNREADELNALRLNAINSPLVVAKGYYEIYDFALSDEKIEKWIKSLSVNENLHLKVGAKVIFTTNRWGEFYNGEQGVIEKFVEKDGV